MSSTGVARITEENEEGRVTFDSISHVATDVTVAPLTDGETFCREVIAHFPQADLSKRYRVEFWTEDTSVQREEWDRRWVWHVAIQPPLELSETWALGRYEGTDDDQ